MIVQYIFSYNKNHEEKRLKGIGNYQWKGYYFIDYFLLSSKFKNSGNSKVLFVDQHGNNLYL